MPQKLPDFSQLQWEFLSVIAAFDKPVSLDVVGKVVHLPHGQFLELIRKCESLNWICQEDNGHIGLTDALPDNIRLKIIEVSSSAKLVKIVGNLKSGSLNDNSSRRAPKDPRKSLDKNATIESEMDLAIEALRKCERGVAKEYVKRIDLQLSSAEEDLSGNTWSISKAIRLSEFCIVRSVGLSTVVKILEKVIIVANRIGDERSWTMAHLLLGRIYWLQNRLNEAASYISKGREKVEALGDRDILSYANLFIGLYYYFNGYLNESINYLKAVTQPAWRYEEYVLAYEAPILLSYSYINRCEFQQAVGTIDFFRLLAIKREDYYTASLYRAMLGTTLRVIGKKEEALFHLEGSQADALAADNMIGYWIGLTGLSCLYLSEGEMDKGIELLHKALSVAKEAGVTHQIFHSIYLESYFKAEQAGCDVPDEWHFDHLFERIMVEPNTNLQGVALRLRAMKSAAEGKDEESILNDLQKSQALLERCQDSFQLAKTKAELVRFYLKSKNYEMAQSLANEIYNDVGGNWELIIPDDLGFLLEKKDLGASEDYENSLNPTLRILEELFSGPYETMKMDLFLSTLSRFFRAERSGLFIFDDTKGKMPELHSARNLSCSIVHDPNFGPSMDMIIASHQSRKPILSKSTVDASALNYKGWSAMCLPLLSEKRVRFVLYFENSYMPNCFDYIQMPILESLGRRLAGIVENQELVKREAAGEQDPSYGIKHVPDTISDGIDIIAKDPRMIKLLRQSKNLAESEAPILILGETGVGKEVIAQWIHRNSFRRDKPFIVVDLTTIPENLMESELFGHEKGAFTGAHSQKIGRVELSEGGTLFFDEIGEIPIHLQAKLLRLLEKKSFMRVGGTKAKNADFRLVAATNRYLYDEVRAGRFREDLYYRLNTLELIVPPLRERKADIIALAEHFVAKDSKKYHKKLLKLTEQQKSIMKSYTWPGNVRELKNVIERAVLVAEENRLDLDLSNKHKHLSVENPFSDFPTLDEIQRRYIRYVLDHTGGKIGGKGGAAEILDMKRTSLNSRMRNLKMR